jgi:hypothetical protein
MYFVFKHGQYLQAAVGSKIPIPEFMSASTLIHTKMMFKVECTRAGCAWCKESQQRSSSSPGCHFISYYVSTKEGHWLYEVDIARFQQEPHAWTFVSVPLMNGSAESARLLIHSQLGKPLNWSGYYLNYLLGTQYGVKKLTSDLNLQTQPSWLCVELGLALLSKYGYREMFQHLVPCQTTPILFWSSLRFITGAKVLYYNPAISTAKQVDAYTLHWPPGGSGSGRK